MIIVPSVKISILIVLVKKIALYKSIETGGGGLRITVLRIKEVVEGNLGEGLKARTRYPLVVRVR